MSATLQISPRPASPNGSAVEALDALRAVRRHRRIGDVAWGDLAYRVYTTALGVIVLVIFASGLVGDDELDRAALDRFVELGPQWAGLVCALAVVMGARSGSRGGPIALDAPDVHILLLAPIPRTRVLRRPLAGTVGYGAAGAGAVGALTGLLFAQRMPGGNAAFIASGMLFGVATALFGFGAALIVASRRIPTWVGLAAALLVVLVSVAQLAGAVPWAPMTLLGQVLIWPLEFRPWSTIAPIVAVAMAVLGAMWIGGISIEAAQRRTRLVGQLRFAVTQQDLRSVLLLRRQLAAEHPISRNRLRWISDPIGRRLPVLARNLASFGRWPRVRIARVGVLAIGAGFAGRGIWDGTTPLVLVAGLCTYVAALDAIEPLAQEIDHPLLSSSYPVERGILFQRFLGPPAALMVIVFTLAAVPSLLVAPSRGAVAVAAITVPAAAFSAVAAAAISVVGEAILSAVDQAMMPPEVAGPRVVLKTVWPPLVAISGFAPVLAAQRALRAGGDAVSGAALAAIVPLALAAAVFVWVRYRDDLHQTMNEAMGR